MKAQEQTLRAFLGGAVQFVTPGFQRPYSWGREAWDAIRESLTVPHHGEHFLGAMATMPLNAHQTPMRKYLLVDGQHRLITAMILMAALRDSLHATQPSRSREMTESCLLNPGRTGDQLFKLLPNRNDRAAFEAVMTGTPHRGVRLITQAHAYFQRHLEPLSDIERLEACDALTLRFMVVSIELERDENPYPIFKSLSNPEQPFTRTGLAAYYRFSTNPSLMALIAGGESQDVEFKEFTFNRPPGEKEDGRHVMHIVRAVAGFLNSTEGGTLLLGVRDNGTIRGIEEDYPAADRGKPTWDGFQLFLANLLRTRLHAENAFLHYAITRETVDGNDLAIIRIRPSPKPIYVEKQLFVRNGNQTLAMQGPDLVHYVANRWPNEIRAASTADSPPQAQPQSDS